jgi:hypothetical protein
MVALYEGHPVGFRGYFPLNYVIPGKGGDFVVLCAGDTCVHPDHRRKGLSVRMGNEAMEAFAGTYEVILNTTATAASLPGYARMGFQPVAAKAYLSRYGLAGFLKYLIMYKRRQEPGKGRIPLGISGPVHISDRARPEEMSAVCAEQGGREGRIQLAKDMTFFRWRFRSPANQYVFYYRYERSEMSGYVVVGLSPNHRRGYVLDFGDRDRKSTAALLRFITRQRHFDILSVYSFCLDESFRETLKALRFKTNGLVRRIERRKRGELPVLVRRLGQDRNESDWMIEGLDIRKIENWKLTEICSDAV